MQTSLYIVEICAKVLSLPNNLIVCTSKEAPANNTLVVLVGSGHEPPACPSVLCASVYIADLHDAHVWLSITLYDVIAGGFIQEQMKCGLHVITLIDSAMVELHEVSDG